MYESKGARTHTEQEWLLGFLLLLQTLVSTKWFEKVGFSILLLYIALSLFHVTI